MLHQNMQSHLAHGFFFPTIAAAAAAAAAAAVLIWGLNYGPTDAVFFTLFSKIIFSSAFNC
jgi:hypothetical protein